MRANFVKAEEIAKGFWQVEFEAVDTPISFEPGQFFNLTLVNPKYTDERGNSRYFGFTTLPGQKTFQMIMKTGVSAFKKSLLEMNPGEYVEIDKLGGKNEILQNPNSPVVFICKGIGIAPVISMIRYYMANNLTQNMTLVYLNENLDNAPFINEIKSYLASHSNFKLIMGTIVDEKLLRDNFENLASNLYFVKGEPKFVVPTAQLIKSLSVEANKVSMEIFTGY